MELSIEVLFSIGIMVVVLLLALMHIFYIDKYHKQKKKVKKVIKRDFLGAPIHTVFVGSDSLMFVGVFYYFKDMAEKHPVMLFLFGFSLMIFGTILYRWLHLWYESDKKKKYKKKRIRKFG